jgi:teichuronic acid biosynthesis glycosyltransferase TuaG
MTEGQTYEKGLVSIITPVFMAERFIGQTILSVQAQTYRQWELLLIDDCSTDGSADVIRPLAAHDPRIRYVRLEHNSGAAVARNKALELARGEYIAFLDADDLWVDFKLEHQLRFMADRKADFVFAAIVPVDEEGTPMRRPIPVPAKADYRHLLSHTVIATSTVMLNRTKLPDFRMPLRRGGQDYATWLQILRETGYAYGLNETLTVYRTSSDSLSSNKLDSVRQVFEIQTQDEHINPLSAALNTLCFCWYAFKKHYM